jgi:hypothetical protein
MASDNLPDGFEILLRAIDCDTFGVSDDTERDGVLGEGIDDLLQPTTYGSLELLFVQFYNMRTALDVLDFLDQLLLHGNFGLKTSIKDQATSAIVPKDVQISFGIEVLQVA